MVIVKYKLHETSWSYCKWKYIQHCYNTYNTCI